MCNTCTVVGGAFFITTVMYHVLWTGKLSASSRPTSGEWTLMRWEQTKYFADHTCGKGQRKNKERKQRKWKSHDRVEGVLNCYCETAQLRELLQDWNEFKDSSAETIMEGHTRSLSLLCCLIFALHCQNHSEHRLNTFKTSNQIYP